MSSSITATKITTKRGSHDDATAGKLTIYHVGPPDLKPSAKTDARPQENKSLTCGQYVMTPIIFVSFLVSLALVDLNYSIRRSQFTNGPGRLPGWLHHVLYRPTASGASGGSQDGYYHSKQKKLAKMEMADAFEIRGTVVAVLLALCASTGWGAWAAGCWAWRAMA